MLQLRRRLPLHRRHTSPSPNLHRIQSERARDPAERLRREAPPHQRHQPPGARFQRHHTRRLVSEKPELRVVPAPGLHVDDLLPRRRHRGGAAAGGVHAGAADEEDERDGRDRDGPGGGEAGVRAGYAFGFGVVELVHAARREGQVSVYQKAYDDEDELYGVG